ncbi:MAG: phosphotransferase [Candidatus Sulfobium sp.]
MFLPAAGFSERLRPISTKIAKPLLPVMGRPVLDTLLEKVSALPVSRIGINTHYKAESVAEHAARSAYSAKIVVFHEPKILGTGGALGNAASLLGKSVFLVHNADILSGIDLTALMEAHLASGNIATLAVRDYPAINNVWIDRAGGVSHVGQQAPGSGGEFRPVTYTGVAFYSPGFLRFLGEGRSEVVPAWLAAASSGSVVGTVDVSGAYWSDIGTPDAYAAAVFHALGEEGEMSYVHPSVQCDRADIGGLAVIERGSIFEGRASLRNCVVLPGARVRHGEKIENAIAGPDFRVLINEPVTVQPSAPASISGLLTAPPEKITFTLIGSGGSDRKYYRVRDYDKTAVLLECARTDPDYRRQITYSRFLSGCSVPVAGLIAEEPGTGDCPPAGDGHVHALFEDLGDLSLYSWTRCARDPGRVVKVYRSTIDVLVTLHTVATDNAGKCPPPGFRLFDYHHLRWETDYFMEQFVRKTRGIAPENRTVLAEEFDRLARKVDSAPKSVVHRDFQSQNIMVTAADTPRLIDYQGARIGPPAYDLVSLLWDPYTGLHERMRERLIAYYLAGMRLYYGDLFDEAVFGTSLLPCRLQRHMQALGAYGFLAGEKGKKYFLRHVPAALSYLREETEAAGSEFPALCRLVKRL